MGEVMSRNRRLIMLNQMAGPLFRELAEGVAPCFSEGAVLFTGHPDILSRVDDTQNKLQIVVAPGYDRRSKLYRLFSWVRYLAASTSVILRSQKSDHFLLVSNPPLLGGWFWFLNLILRRPYAVLVYDIHPDVLVEMGMLGGGNPIVWLWNGMNRVVYRDAEAVITLNKQMRNRLMNNFIGSDNGVEIIPPWADVHTVAPLSYDDNPLSKEFNPDEKTVVLYSGNMGISHDIYSMLEAAKYLRQRQDILFLFVGAGACWQTAVDFKAEHALTNVEVYPFQPEEKLPYTMVLATLSLVALDEGAEDLMIPSKVFFYLASGSSVVAICRGDNGLRDVVEGADCGVCISPGMPVQLADAIVELVDDNERLDRYRKNARSAAISDYSRESGVDQFISLFTKVGWIPGDCKEENK